MHDVARRGARAQHVGAVDADHLHALFAVHSFMRRAREQERGPAVAEAITPEHELRADAAVLARCGRTLELRLDAQERVLDQQVGAAVAIVITNQRIAAYGVLSGWRSLDRMPNEQIEKVTAEDYAGLVVTSARMLNFNGETGVFAERKRAVAR